MSLTIIRNYINIQKFWQISLEPNQTTRGEAGEYILPKSESTIDGHFLNLLCLFIIIHGTYEDGVLCLFIIIGGGRFLEGGTGIF